MHIGDGLSEELCALHHFVLTCKGVGGPEARTHGVFVLHEPVALGQGDLVLFAGNPEDLVFHVGGPLVVLQRRVGRLGKLVELGVDPDEHAVVRPVVGDQRLWEVPVKRAQHDVSSPAVHGL